MRSHLNADTGRLMIYPEQELVRSGFLKNVTVKGVTVTPGGSWLDYFVDLYKFDAVSIEDVTAVELGSHWRTAGFVRLAQRWEGGSLALRRVSLSPVSANNVIFDIAPGFDDDDDHGYENPVSGALVEVDDVSMFLSSGQAALRVVVPATIRRFTIGNSNFTGVIFDNAQPHESKIIFGVITHRLRQCFTRTVMVF